MAERPPLRGLPRRRLINRNVFLMRSDMGGNLLRRGRDMKKLIWAILLVILLVPSASMGGTLWINGIETSNSTTSDYSILSGTAESGDAALNFFGAGVTAVTDATACTDIEGDYLSIAAGVLNVSGVQPAITGTDTHVMFFDGANTPAGDAGMTYNKTTDLLSVGRIRGNISEIYQPTSDTLAAEELKGTLISNYEQGAVDNLQTLPTAAEGMSFVAICGTAQAANYFGFRADTNDKFYLNGVAGADNGIVKINAPVVGAIIYFFTFKTGAGVYDWIAITVYGTWVAA
jgi:hypothetical protein